MKTILRIAKTELRLLFYSPIAWFLLIVFMIQCAIVYIGPVDSYAKTQELGSTSLRWMSDLTERIYFDRSGLFGSVIQNLYLYIPLLTMSLISRETGSGTIKLLFSSPIKVREIIFGKYLAMMAYSLLLVGIIAIFVVSGIFQIESPETGMLLAALLGFYLLLCAYSAIGLFMSTLSTYQIVAAISTFVMIGILSYIGNLWQRIEFVRDLTYFLSINGRTQKMLAGLITTKDVIYFFVIVYIFLGLSVYRLKASTESKPFWVRAGRNLTIIASALLIGYVSSIPRFIGYYDATIANKRTLTPQVQKVLKDLDGAPLEITAYNNLLGNYWWIGSPEYTNRVNSIWEQYNRFKTDIIINKTILYYDSTGENSMLSRQYPGKTIKEIAEKYAKTNDIDLSTINTPEQMRKIKDMRPEQNRYVMELKWKGRSTMLRVFDDQQIWPGETEVAAAFKRLQSAKLPKIGFLTGHLERNINKRGERDYKILTTQASFRYALVNQGFDVDTLSLENQEVPENISTLVIADPKLELDASTIAHVQNFINKGGNLIIAGEPGKQAVLNPLLKTLGVQMMEGMLVQENRDLAPNLITTDFSKLASSFTPDAAANAADSMKVAMPTAAALSFANDGAFNIQPLLSTNGKISWNRIKPLDMEMAMSAKVSTGADAAEEDDAEETASAASPTPQKKVAKPSGNTSSKPAAGEALKARQQKAIELQNALNEVMRGEGTKEEKQKKARELFEKANKEVEASLPPAEKKRLDSVRALATAISNGAGTQEEKQQKMAELMANVKKDKEARAKAEAEKPAATSATPAVQTATAQPVAASNADNRPRRRNREANAGTVTYSSADGDTKGPLPTVLALTRKINGKEQRIIISGDADFMSNGELTRNNMRTANFSFNTALFSWLTYGEFPIDATRPKGKDNRVKLNMAQVSTFRVIYVWILPALLLAGGAILLIRRKRK